MAIAIINEEKFKRAKETVRDKEGNADDQALLVEYIRIGGKVIEGSNDQIERTPKMYGIYDKKKKVALKTKPTTMAKKKAKKGKKK